MSEGNSGWPDYPAQPTKLKKELAPLAELAGGTEPTERDKKGRFLTGNSGGGRQPGSRNRLTETFIAAVEIDFAEHGHDALATLRADDPGAYLRIVASLVPRDLILKREQERDFVGMEFSDLMEFIENVRHNATVERQIHKAKLGLA